MVGREGHKVFWNTEAEGEKQICGTVLLPCDRDPERCHHWGVLGRK